MSSLKPVRGTHDILPEESLKLRLVEETANSVALLYGYGEISTPIFEATEVFVRTLGDTSDIVAKEMYTFEDRGGDSITLRPENTAGVARAIISNGLAQSLPLKFFYRGPMFRYERPQKGRTRQFHQVGIELLGIPQPLADVEVIAMGAHFLKALGIAEKTTLELNTLGDGESRSAYREKLASYLRDHKEKLSKDSLFRLERNPLRILDSKDEGDRAIIEGAPLIEESLNDLSKRFFDSLLAGLAAAGVKYVINPYLVRGLDYYCHSAFEFTTKELGAQGAVLAGGRYDGLIKQMGGPSIPGTGWAAGVERLTMLIDRRISKKRPIAVIPVGPEHDAGALALSQRLRQAGFTVDLGYSGDMGKRMKRADKINACAALFLGADEQARAAARVRNMDTGEQKEEPLASLEEHLKRYN